MTDNVTESTLVEWLKGVTHRPDWVIKYAGRVDGDHYATVRATEVDTVTSGVYGADRPQQVVNTEGRWPANVVLDDTQAAELDQQSGVGHCHGPKWSNGKPSSGIYGDELRDRVGAHYGDVGGASRFFPVFTGDPHETEHIWCDCVPQLGPPHCHLCSEIAGREMPWTEAHPDFPTFRYTAKAPGTERPTADGVAHPTVKPVDLMRWLIRLVTPPNGVVLDPFAGSGTTGEAAIHEHKRAILIEREPTYLPLIIARLSKPMAVGFDFEVGA
jgi:hypothetical protein